MVEITKSQCAKFLFGIVAITSFLLTDYLMDQCISVTLGTGNAICGAEARRSVVTVMMVAYAVALCVWALYRVGRKKKPQ